MTRPGSVVVPQPGWWPRVDRIGVTEGGYGWSATVTGFDPTPVDFDMTLTPAIGMVGAEHYYRDMVVAFNPIIGLNAEQLARDFGINLTPAFGMDGAERYARSFGIGVSPTIGVAGIQHAAGFGITVTPVIGMGGAERYWRTFSLDGVTPAVGMSGAQLARSFDLAVTPVFAMGGAERYSRSFTLDDVSVAVGMSGAEHYPRTFTVGVTPSFTMSGVGISPPGYGSVGAGEDDQASNRTVSWSHTITTENYVFAAVLAQYASDTYSVTAATYGGNAMTFLGSVELGGTLGLLALYGYPSPPTGTSTVSITVNFNAFLIGNSVAYDNVGSLGTAVTASGVSTSPSQSVTCTPGQLIINFMGNEGNHVMSSYSGGTQRSLQRNASSTSETLIMGDENASTTFSASIAAADNWGSISVVAST